MGAANTFRAVIASGIAVVQTIGPPLASLSAAAGMPSVQVITAPLFATAIVPAAWAAPPETLYGSGGPTPDYQAHEQFARDSITDPSTMWEMTPDGQIHFNTGDPDNPQVFTQEDLFGGPVGTQADVDALRDYDGNHSGLVNRAFDDQEVYDAETQPGGVPSPRGEAYRVMSSAAERPHLDLSNDPIALSSRQAYDRRGDIINAFASCQETPVTTSGSSSTRIPEYHYCQKVNAPNGQSVLYHDYDVSPFIEITNREGGGGSPNSESGTRSCGNGCIEVFIGRVGDNYWSGGCTEHIQRVSVGMLRSEALISAQIVDIRWDDHTQLSANGNVVFTSNDGYPQQSNFCETKTSNVLSTAIDVTATLRATGSIDFEQRTQVADKGEAYSVLRLRYNPSALLDDRGYRPESVYQNAAFLDDSTCAGGSAQRLDSFQPQSVSPGQCAIFHGNVTICPTDFVRPPPSREVSDFWRETLISTSCTPHYGTYCWTDMNGQQRCHTSNSSNNSGNNCDALEQDQTCGFLDSYCMEGATGANGTCYVTEYKYDCGVTVDRDYSNITTQTTCAGELQCIGESCFTHEREVSDQFAEATASMAAVRQIAADSECSTETGQCTVFPGKAYDCKTAVGGVQDCCNSGATAPSIAQYISLLVAMDKINSAVGGLQVMQPIYGAWEAFRGEVAQNFSSVWSHVTEPFSSILDNIGGATAETVSSDVAPTAFLDQTKQLLLNKAHDFVNFISPDLANLLFQPAASGGTDYVLSNSVQAAANFAGAIMGAYAAYQAAVLLIQLVYACEAHELEMEVKRQLKVCEDYGSYCKTSVLGACVERRQVSCCYNSPLSRIMMTQIYQQLGTGAPWASARQIGGTVGQPSQPYCGGLTIEDIDKVDFGQIDLSEWIALLTIAGEIPDGNEAAERYTMDSMTGQGSTYDTSEQGGHVRQNAADRAISRTESAQPDQRANEARGYYWDGDTASDGDSAVNPTGTPHSTTDNRTGYSADP